VDLVPHAEAARFVARNHYARGMANTSVLSCGLFRTSDGALVGACTFLPTLGNSARGLSATPKRVLSLSRLCVAPGEGTNAATLLLGAALRLLGRDPRWTLVVTYADEGEGHTGTIYRASNWTYQGATRARVRWVDPATDRMVSTKRAGHTRTREEMIALGYEARGPFRKHRFVYALDRGRRRPAPQLSLFGE